MYSKPILNFEFEKEEHKSVGLPFQRNKEMYLYCNLVEFLRLREELILSVYENRILEKIYLSQRRYAKASDDRNSMYFRHPLKYFYT